MNTFQLTSVLKSDSIVSGIFYGVFPIDELPDISSKPAAFVVNLDDSSQPGSHWVAVYFDEHDKCEYFDTYGRPPDENVIKYMEKYSTKIKFNKKCVQQLFSSTCGQMCVYYLVWRSRDVPLKEIVSSLDKSYADEFVRGFVNNLFKANTVVVDKTFLIDQICQIFQ